MEKFFFPIVKKVSDSFFRLREEQMLQFNLAETSLDVFFQIRLTLVVILLVLLMSFNLAFFSVLLKEPFLIPSIQFVLGDKFR